MFMSISTNRLSMIIGIQTMSIINIRMGLSGMGRSRIAIRMCIRRCGIGMRIFRMCIIGMSIEVCGEGLVFGGRGWMGRPDATKPALGGLCR